MSDTKPIEKRLDDILPLNTTRKQVIILNELLTMKGLGFPPDQGIAIGTLLEMVQEKLKE